LGSHNTSQNPSRRPSTEESIDTEDEWYKHEIRELEQEEYEKKIEAIKPSASINSKLSHVLIELTATVAKIEYEDCQKHDKAMKAKQEAIPGPEAQRAVPPGPPSTPNPLRAPPHRGGLGPPGPPTGAHQPLAMEVDSMGQPIDATSEELNDHKKVIMRFQGSEDFEEEAGGAGGTSGGGRNQQPHIVHGGLDQLDLEDEEDESSHAEAIAKRRGRRGRSGDESSPDSDATQSGPDSLMEDTGGSSDNILDSSNQEKRATKKGAIAVAASAAIVAQTQPPIPINLKAPVAPSTLPISPTTAAAARLASARPEAASKISPRISPDKSHKSTSSSGGSRRSRKSIKTASLEAAANGEAVEAGEEDWNDEDYANGGYHDENGEWVEASGYYDENGDWVETGGYYNESGEWVEYAGYYDENGEWVDVEVPETGFPEEGTEHVEHQQAEDGDQYYEDTGGGHGMLG
jgi:hypothetical protein